MWLYLHCGVRVGSLAGQPGGWLIHPGHPKVPAPPLEHQSLVMGSVEVDKSGPSLGQPKSWMRSRRETGCGAGMTQGWGDPRRL